MNPESVQILESQSVFNGNIINVKVDKISDQHKKLMVREVVEHKPAVAIVPIDEDDNVIMVRQYRHPTS